MRFLCRTPYLGTDVARSYLTVNRGSLEGNKKGVSQALVEKQWLRKWKTLKSQAKTHVDVKVIQQKC
jgi:hypothetical protein